MKIKRDPADDIFSKYIRLRDKMCMRCFSPVRYNDQGLPNSHEASHYFGRGAENTRFDPENVDTLCTGCHVIWGGRDREEYRIFKIDQLGEKGFADLTLRSNLYCKKDRKTALMYSRTLLESVLE